MLPVSLGIVSSTSPGTPVRIKATVDTNKHLPQSTDLWANRVVFQVPPATASLTGNTGPVYIGDSTLVTSTGVGMFFVLQPGDSSAVAIGSWGNKIWVPGLFLDVDTSGDGVIVYVETD